MKREDALELLKEYNKEEFHIQHAITVECVMRYFAQKLGSLKKKFKDKKFAAGCSRDIIKQGSEILGWELEKLFEETILAMRECEDYVSEQLETLK